MLIQKYGGVIMARPRKMTTEQMISVIDSYYLVQVQGNPKKLKCSMIAAYATELGYQAEGYDFARNIEVREYIERMKCVAELEVEKSLGMDASYKSLDIISFMSVNSDRKQLARSLTELDSYWKNIYEKACAIAAANQKLISDKNKKEGLIKSLEKEFADLTHKVDEVTEERNKTIAENRYLKKMLRKYLYPAVADEILMRDNILKSVDTKISDEAVANMIEQGNPRSLNETIASDVKLQTEDEILLKKMWGMCDEGF